MSSKGTIIAAAVFLAVVLLTGLTAVVVHAQPVRTGFFSVESQVQFDETYFYRLIDRELGTVCYYRHTSRLPPTSLGCVKYTEPPAQPRKL